ncbi:type II toxin-antitoxin system ParD family antitoxin [Methylocystis bryophila]|uniref:Addiction module antidote protein n=1 Tax=Methylocystis bryophila TaxID=655015 RepID=A0A1W6N1B9_9HYPH|nr:type II toxin-antitoxin system ParD family antitoxin [Methylocystis bryophila]ARN83607.1 addiction module antidote protein [Methylocystis bryophila]BDV37761.1 hypothetical protein DSM21852_10140 [Methylocystis bryophila]
MNVTLPPELERFVQDKIKSGLFDSEAEVVRAALRLMEDQDRPILWAEGSIREKIAAGLASLKAGQGVDGEAVFERMETEMDEEEARSRS